MSPHEHHGGYHHGDLLFPLSFVSEEYASELELVSMCIDSARLYTIVLSKSLEDDALVVRGANCYRGHGST